MRELYKFVSYEFVVVVVLGKHGSSYIFRKFDNVFDLMSGIGADFDLVVAF